MPNPEHLAILKQGVEVWNEWGKLHPYLQPFLTDADLSGADLSGAFFSYTLLGRADLTLANLSRADLVGAILNGSFLSGANLSHARLDGTNLSSVVLDGASLRQANLSFANIQRPYVRGADFTDSYWQGTRLAEADVRGAIGLDAVTHLTPSTIGIDTLYLSSGEIPESFLRGCGLSDWQIESAKLYRPELSNEEITNTLYRIHDLRAHQAIQVSPLFISYSHADNPFVNLMEAHLNERGVRFWRDVNHSTAGRLETQIDRAIRLNPTVLLVLSEHSVRSDWVEHEARTARKLEQETGRDVLCPVALDDSWKTCRWPERLREQIMEYNVLDFSNWQDPDYMRRMFARLIDGLGLFYK